MSDVSDLGDSANPARPATWQVISCYAVSIVIAYTFIKYLHVKFIPDPDKAVIFRDIEEWTGIAWVNPYFRFFTGGVEAVASLILFIPGLQIVGAIVSLATMLLAMYLHLLGPIGIEGGRGWLALENVLVQACALWIIYVRRHEIGDMIRFMFTDRTLTGRKLHF